MASEHDLYSFKTPLQQFIIREDMMSSLMRYLNDGIPTGSFLRAVLAHDLMEACAHADHWNLGQLPAYAAFMYNEIPSICHGSYEIVDRWIELGGLNGKQKQHTANATPESG